MPFRVAAIFVVYLAPKAEAMKKKHVANEQYALAQQLTQLRKENDILKMQTAAIEKQLADSEARFSVLYQSMPEGIIISRDHQITSVNDTACQMHAYARHQFLGLPLHVLFAPADVEEIIAKIDTDEDAVFEALCMRQNKTLFPAKVSVQTVVRDDIVSKILLVQDLTHTKNVEQELQQSERMYQKLFEESGDAIYVSGVRGEMLTVNSAMIELFGYTREEMMGMNAVELYANDDDREKFKQVMEQSGTVSNYEIKLCKKDGTEMDCLMSSNVRRNISMEIIGYQGIIRDITERNRTQALIKAKELAERSARLKEHFLANMSHEIRTPMNAVIGMTNLLADTPLQAEQQKYVRGIQSASEHLLVLINDILDFSKIEAGQLQLETIAFNLNDILQNALHTFRYKAADRHIAFQLVCEDNVPTALIGDPTRLTQILFNLLSNAIKFTDADGTVRLEIKVFSEDIEKAFIAFSVADTGIGIPEDKLYTIFDSFTQVSSNTTRKFGGTGLGLTITKKLVEMQGGSISVRSEVGKGSEFIFAIKYIKAEDKIAPTEQPTEAVIKPLAPLYILLAEDNLLNQIVAADTIRKWGKNIKIDIANNGKEAIDKILSGNVYDLIIMDVQMPEMSGLDATKYIRKALGMNDLPILAMTAYATTGEAEKTLISGMNDYISKPFNPIQLYQKIVKLTQVAVLDEIPDTLPSAPSIKTTATSEFNTTIADFEPNAERVTNLAFLEESVGGDPSLALRMVEIMLLETPDEIGQMEQLAQSGSWERLGSLAHKFKSAATYMGSEELKELVKNLQFNAQHQLHTDTLPQAVQRIKYLALKACQEMQQYFDQLAQQNKG